MTMDLLLISASVALMVLTVILVTLFMMLTRSLANLAELLRGLQREMTPVLSDLRIISRNTAVASESLKNGLQGASRMSEALGNIGSDLEEGRKAVKGTMNTLGALAGPWLGFLKLFKN